MRNSSKKIEKGNEKTGEEVTQVMQSKETEEVSQLFENTLVPFFIIYDFCEEKMGAVSIIFLDQSLYIAVKTSSKCSVLLIFVCTLRHEISTGILFALSCQRLFFPHLPKKGIFFVLLPFTKRSNFSRKII